MKKRSVRILGHRTSISLEEPFWIALKREADIKGLSLNALIAHIDEKRALDTPECNLSSAIRLYILENYRQKACEPPLS